MTAEFRAEFPFFDAHPELTYLDSAATTQKPYSVINAVHRHFTEESCNPGRGNYRLASALERRIDGVRSSVAHLVGEADPSRVAFTSGATASLNAVAQCWGRANLQAGDEILLSPFDHAANVAPWLALAAERGLTVSHYRLTNSGDADVADVVAKVSRATKLILLTHVHNVFGERTSVDEVRRRVGPLPYISVDAAQSVGHTSVDVVRMGADFLSFSGHKMFAPPGVGVLWVSSRAMEEVEPSIVGGGMDRRSGLAGVIEVGTLNTAAVIGLGAAVDFVLDAGLADMTSHLGAATRRLVERLQAMPHLRLLPGIAFSTGCTNGYGIVSFTVPGVRAADVGFILDAEGICVRTGGQCSYQSDVLGETVRVSLHAYNTDAELDRLCHMLTTLKSAAA